eukprot:15437552-Alexandrium_andersonii.AAC.1
MIRAAGGLDAAGLARVSNRTASASRVAGVQLVGESNIGWVLPDSRVEGDWRGQAWGVFCHPGGS